MKTDTTTIQTSDHAQLSDEAKQRLRQNVRTVLLQLCDMLCRRESEKDVVTVSTSLAE